MRREEIVEKSNSTTTPSINGRYDRFNIKLGKGSFKDVYKAFDRYKQIDVAWNSINLSSIHNEHEKKQMLQECEMLARLNHPNILKITNQWLNNTTDELCFITNIVYDGSLSRFFRKRQINLLKVKQISEQILDALFYLHNMGVIHRDLKCDNIFIEGNTGKIVLGDLGLSCNIVSAKSIVGTPHCMAPEIYKEHYNEMVDIWSFGMCVLQLITSLKPYNECKDIHEVRKHVLSGTKPESLCTIKDLSVKTFINICLTFDYHMRPSAAELLNHPFLYHRTKDVILCNELLNAKNINNECMSVVNIKQAKHNGNNIKIKLQIVCSKFSKIVEFDFDYKHEKPLSVAIHMIKELKLANIFTYKVEKAIKNAIVIAMNVNKMTENKSVSSPSFTVTVPNTKCYSNDCICNKCKSKVKLIKKSSQHKFKKSLPSKSANGGSDLCKPNRQIIENMESKLEQIITHLNNSNHDHKLSYWLVCGCSLFGGMIGVLILFIIYVIYKGKYQPY